MEDNKELFKIELQLLNEFKRVCKQNKLTYAACGGTLLGAVRHKGFIPWDDDIDLFMLRDDYEKLYKLSHSFKKGYFLQNTYSDDILRSHMQLRLDNTTCLLRSDYKKKYHRGIFIDIFPLDYVPDDDKEFINFRNKLNKEYSKLILPSYKSFSKKPRLIVNIYNLLVPIRKLFYKIKELFRGSYKSRYKKYEELASSYNHKTNSLSGISFWATIKGYEPNKFDASLFNKIIDVKFEDTTISIPEGYDEILKIFFSSDYMIPKKVSTTHGLLYIDIYNSYLKYDKINCLEFMDLFKEDIL